MDINLLLEAEKRGILPEEKKPLLDEARKRGLVSGGLGGDDAGYYQSPPDWMRNVVKPTLEGLGMAGGAALASPTLATPVGPAVESLATAGGYAFGKKSYEILEDVFFGKGRNKTPYAQTATGAMEETAKDFSTGLWYDLTGKLIPPALNALIGVGQPYKSKLFSEVPTVGKPISGYPETTKQLNPELQDKIDTFNKYGIDYSYGDIVPDAMLPAKIEKLLQYRAGSSDPAFTAQLSKIKRLNDIRNMLVEKQGPKTTIESFNKQIHGEVDGLLTKYKDSKDSKLNSMLDDFADSFGIKTKHEAGATFESTMGKAKEQLAQKRTDDYTNLANELPGKGTDVVEPKKLIQTAQKLLDEQLSIPNPRDRNSELVARLQGYLKLQQQPSGGQFRIGNETIQITPQMVEKDPQLSSMLQKEQQEPVTWYGLDKTRSALLERNRSIQATTKMSDTSEQRANNMLSDSILDDMGDYAKSKGDNLWKLYQTARQSESVYRDLFDKDMLKIMNLPPEQVVRKILKSGDQGITLLRQIKSATGDIGIEPLRQNFFGELINSAQKDGIVNTSVIKNTLRKFGNDNLELLATPEQIKFLNDISKKGETFALKTGNRSPMESIKFLENMSKAQYGNMIDMLLHPGAEHNIYLAKKLLSSESLQQLKSLAMERALITGGTGNFLPVSSAKKMAIGEGTGLEVPLSKLFNGDMATIKEFINMGKDMHRVEELARNTSLTAGTLLGAHDISSFFTHPVSATGAFILQKVLAKTYFNPSARNMMLTAWKLGPNSSRGVELFGKAVRIATEPKQPKEEIPTPEPEPKTQSYGGWGQ
jgi:hypothetical protein